MKTYEFCIKKLGGVFLFLAIVIAYCLAVKTVPVEASVAVPTVNGLFYGDDDDNLYTKVAVAEGNRGTVYAYDDGSTLYFAVIVSPTVNDNAIDKKQGDNAYVKSVGWPQGKSHCASDLIGSDMVQLKFSCNGTVYEWMQGLAYYDNGWKSGVADGNQGSGAGTGPVGLISSSSTAWNYQNSNWWTNDPSARTSNTTDTDNWRSPGYAEGASFNKVTHGYPEWDAANQWEWSLVYEMSFPHPCPGEPFYLEIVTAHNSPSKDGNENVPIKLYDYGDAPAPYPTLLANNGARHLITTALLHLGAQLDAEADGQPNADATGDDNNGVDDEDGVTFTSVLVHGANNSVVVTASGTGKLSAWIDFNHDGDWLDTGEKIISDVSYTAAGSKTLTFTVPGGAATGDTYARFRFSSQSGLAPTGLANDGEVEDYKVTVLDGALDWGDCPDTGAGTGPGNYQTTVNDFGPCHVMTAATLRLGELVDAETDGLQSAGANGDDNTGLDDEDGVIGPLVFVLGTQPAISVKVLNSTGSPAVLSGWIDMNKNGVFEANERSSLIIPTGTNGVVHLLMPTLTGGEGFTFARFRLSTQDDNGDGHLEPTGALTNGEVEDYQVQLTIGSGDEDHGDAPTSYGDPAHTSLNNNLQLGPTNGSGNVLVNVDGESISYFSQNASGDDHSNDNDENGVISWLPLKTSSTSYSVTIYVFNQTGAAATLVGWIDFNKDGVFSANEAVVTTIAGGIIGPVVLTWTGLSGLTEGTTYARFRIAPETSGLSASTPEGTVSGGEVEDYPLLIENPIGVDLTSFSAMSGRNGVQVEWEVQSAINHAGYHLYRSTTENGNFVRLNEKLITTEYAVSAGRYQYADNTAGGVSNYYKLEEVSLDGALKSYGPITVTATGVDGQSDLPTDYSLAQNYPNPFNPTTTIAYTLPEAAQVTLEVTDMTGRRIRTLISGMEQAGSHQIVWDAKNDQGMQVASGAYIYRIIAGDFTAIRKMTLIR